MKIVVVDGPMRGQSFPLDKASIVIGRGRSADICLPLDPLISRFHAQIVERDGRHFVEDMGSGNGTWIAGERIDDAVELPARRFARIGHTHVCLLEDSASTDDLMQQLTATAPDREATEALPTGESTGQIRALAAEQKVRQWDTLPVDSSVQVVAEDRPDRPVEVAGTIDPRSVMELPASTDSASVNRLKKRLRVFQDVAVALAGKMETRELLEAVLDSILKVLPAERAFVLLVDDSARKLTVVVSRQRGRVPDKKVTVSRTLLRKTVREKIALLVHDTLSDAQLSGAQSIVMSAIRAAMSVPVLDGDKVAAVILLDTRSANAFTQDDLELVTAIANQATTALANARLYEELRLSYEELEAAHDQMAQSEKLTLIGTLAASIAHDIGNVMTPIEGIAKLAMKDQNLDPKLKAAFSRQMERLKALTQQLLSFSRPKPPDLLPLDVNQAVQDSLALVQTDARHHGVEMTTDLAQDLPKVRGDINRLDQVFVNLILNAVQAMGEKGGALAISTRRDGDDVVTSFKDSGPGIAPEHLDRIFEAFFTTKGKGGTGMGLFSARRIVHEEHGGKLEARSQVGDGATFSVRLPAVP